MSEKPTLASVAREAGVSITTVSQVMRGTGRISEETRRAVRAAVRKLHYVPDGRAAAMRSGDIREVGILLNQLSNPFNAEVVSGLVDLLEAEGYLLSVLDTRDDAERQERQLQAFVGHGRGGLLWVPALATPDSTFRFLAAHRLPTVTFLRSAGAGFDHVGIRDAEATAAATAYLIGLGHRQIGFLGGGGTTPVQRDRIAGYRQAMADHGVGPGFVWPCDDNRRAGLEAMVELLRQRPATTALVCNGDMVALGASQALTRQGLRPGREVSVIGFDDIEDAAIATPPLTTMAVAPQALGRRLGRALLERIAEPEMATIRVEVIARLVVRETTGAPPPA